MQKKHYSIYTLFFIFSLFIFSGCKPKQIIKNDKINVVCTIYPEFDWTRNIIGNQNDRIILSLLVKNGVDLHSFQPSAQDIIQISTCDLFIYVGGESDKWVKETLAAATNPDMKVINLMEVLGENVKEEEVPEGAMEEEHHHDENEEHHHDEVEYDEHIWLSLRNASICTKAIADSLIQILPDAEPVFSENLRKYQGELELLDRQFSSAVQKANLKTFVFCDRFPFRYFMDDYGLKYYAAFTGCSAETEASFETVAFLANKINELGIKYIYTIETSDEKLPNTVIKNAHNYDCEIIRIDSMQSTTLRSAIGGKTYINTMQKNMEQLEKGLCLN